MKKAAERFIEIHQDKKVVLTELSALLILGAFKARLWDDPNFYSRLNPSVRLKYAAKTAAWLNANTARQGNLETLMEDQEQDPADREKLEILRAKLVEMGGLAGSAVVQIRDFRFGETPWWRRKQGSAISGTVVMGKSVNNDGEPVEDGFIELSGGVHVETDEEIDRLRRAADQLAPPQNPLQNS